MLLIEEGSEHVRMQIHIEQECVSLREEREKL
jgi:hypothetical protein